jgi:tRNA threonylcarbamoyladenosine biosynthesis protein TsaB
VIVLGIETATDVCAVAVLRDDAVLASASVMVPRSHATRLALLVQEALGHARVAPADVGLVAVSAGPGSYTGLRIGASLGRGLCLATGAALVGVGTLDALMGEAFSRLVGSESLLVALPSRRGEVYAAMNDLGGRRIEPQAIALTDLEGLVDAALPEGEPLYVAGAGAPAVIGAFGSRLPLVELSVRPSAERVARLGLAAHVAGTAPGPEAFEPLYLGTFAVTPPAR